MTDLMKRLRDPEVSTKLTLEAADEIERLQDGIREYACTGTDHPCGCYNEFLSERAEIERLRISLNNAVEVQLSLQREIQWLYGNGGPLRSRLVLGVGGVLSGD
jgi:hypothetical protein